MCVSGCISDCVYLLVCLSDVCFAFLFVCLFVRFTQSDKDAIADKLSTLSICTFVIAAAMTSILLYKTNTQKRIVVRTARFPIENSFLFYLCTSVAQSGITLTIVVEFWLGRIVCHQYT